MVWGDTAHHSREGVEAGACSSVHHGRQGSTVISQTFNSLSPFPFLKILSKPQPFRQCHPHSESVFPSVNLWSALPDTQNLVRSSFVDLMFECTILIHIISYLTPIASWPSYNAKCIYPNFKFPHSLNGTDTVQKNKVPPDTQENLLTFLKNLNKKLHLSNIQGNKVNISVEREEGRRIRTSKACRWVSSIRGLGNPTSPAHSVEAMEAAFWQQLCGGQGYVAPRSHLSRP